jgi:type I restriction enzyme S subunit
MTRGDLPEGWALATLGELAELASGAGFPIKYQHRKGFEFPFFKVGNLGEVESAQPLIQSEHTVSRELARELRARVIPTRSVVFAKIGMAIVLNRRRLTGKPACIDNNMMAATPSNAVIPSYLHRVLETQDFSQLSQATTVPSIRKGDLEQLELPLAPLAEQRRMVAKLEMLLATGGACQAKLQQIAVLLKRFRQSVLGAACSGRLTAGWRGENPRLEDGSGIVAKLEQAHRMVGGHRQGNAAPPTEEAHDLSADDLPASWDLTDLRSAVCPDRPITYGILKPGPDVPDGVPYVRVADFPNDRLKLQTIRRTTKEIEKTFSRARLRRGDILLSIRGTVGRVCVVPGELEDANITQDSARLSIQAAFNTSFVLWCLRAPTTQERMRKASKGVAVRGINIGDVRALQLPVPPLAEQKEIVRRVEALFALADKVQARLESAQSQVDKLAPSLLARAFSGELVPTEAELAEREGRGFESADALLERVRLERPATAAHPGTDAPRRESLRKVT